MKKKTIIKLSLVLAFTVALTIIVQVKADSYDSTALIRDTLTLYPTDDALITEEFPNTNYGFGNALNARNRFGGGGSSGWERDGLTKFDLSSLPPGVTIVSGTLNLYYYDCYQDSSDCTGRDLNCYRLISDWDESTVTWNTRPDTASNITSYSTVPATHTWMDWVVTSDVQAFSDGSETNYGWHVMDETYWGTFNIPDSYFRTKDYGSNIPYLEIIYDYSPIPTLNQWGLVILIALLIATAAIILRLRRRAAAL